MQTNREGESEEIPTDVHVGAEMLFSTNLSNQVKFLYLFFYFIRQNLII